MINCAAIAWSQWYTMHNTCRDMEEEKGIYTETRNIDVNYKAPKTMCSGGMNYCSSTGRSCSSIINQFARPKRPKITKQRVLFTFYANTFLMNAFSLHRRGGPRPLKSFFPFFFFHTAPLIQSIWRVSFFFSYSWIDREKLGFLKNFRMFFGINVDYECLINMDCWG